MTRPRLRVTFASDTHHSAGEESSRDVPAQQQVTVPLGDVLPGLVDAFQTQRAWLRDFEEDRITISSDLYEVLIAYRSMRSAA